MRINNKIFASLLLLLCISSAAFASADVKTLLDRLDKSLSHKAEYEKVKTDRIKQLQSLLNETSDERVRFDTERKLFEEYKSYRYDSASVYANRCLESARKMGDPELIIESQCNIAFCLVSAGIPLQADKLLSGLDVSKSSRQIKQNYFFTCYKLWNEEAIRVPNTKLHDEYIALSRVYLDSLCNVVPEDTPEYWDFIGARQVREGKHKEALKSYEKSLSYNQLDTHGKAMIMAEIAWTYIFLNDEDKAIEYFIESAIYDNESATREITALYLLAEHIVDKGESERAIKYIHLALDDINFYNASQRKFEIGGILPQIEQERYNIIRSQRNTAMTAGILALLLMVAIAGSYILLRKKSRQIAIADENVRKSLEEVELMNKELVEANKIKTEYIGQSFYANAEFITKLEKLYKTIERQITTKQFDRIRETVSNRRLEEDRANMYAAFDATFLGLFPKFIEKYNELFEEKDRRYPENENSLTSEMRIFALIRMGITDSERIGKFLDYSIHTVNTYKTRIKNRSIVKNEEFEAKIKEI